MNHIYMLSGWVNRSYTPFWVAENGQMYSCSMKFTLQHQCSLVMILVYHFVKINPSAWSDKHCSSCCTHSLICLYLDNIGSKCNRAALCLFMKELAFLWCGRQLLEIISSFFLCSWSLGFLFAVPNFTDGFMRLSNSEIKHEMNVITIFT